MIMKRVGFLLVGCLLFALTSCEETGNGVGSSEFVLNKQMIQLTVDGFAQLEALDEAGNAVSVKWSSSADSIAVVSANGLVRGVREGTAIVTASNDACAVECAVWVSGAMDLSQYKMQQRSTKRGVGFSFPLQGDATLLAPGVSWSYNWGSQPNPAADTEFMAHGMDYCPMTWNGSFNVDQYRNYKKTHPNCQYLLAFNEPNLTDQANMTPTQAAEHWPKVKALADELGWKIVAPAMNYGTLAGYSDPVKWLDEFFTLVPKSDVCALALHCYMPNANAVKSYVDRFNKYGLPIWMTEFCAWDGFNASSPEPQIRYMSDVLNWMEKDERIERYAWFIPRGSQGFPYYELLDHNYPSNLTDAGKVYVGLSSLDKTTYHPSAMVLAQEYSDYYDLAPQVEASTDVGGELNVSQFYAPNSLEYLVEFTGNEKTLEIRYMSVIGEPIVRIWIDGAEIGFMMLEKTNGEWKTLGTDLTIPKGKHTVRLEMMVGNIKMHWFRFL